MNVKGKLIVKEETVVISDKFQKREFVVETQEDYPQTIQMELHGENVTKLDGKKIGDIVDCDVNLRGRKWTNREGDDKYFNTLVCWKISSETPGARKELVDKLVGNDDLPF